LNTIPVTVLITTANNPPSGMPFLSMTNPVSRMIATKAALYFWVTQGVEQIVLADATGTNLLTAEEEAAIDESETRVEQINYQQDKDLVVKKGKGYGEGKLIEYAINHSELLSRVDHFFKCTGKVYVRNFPAVHSAVNRNNLSNLFWRFMGDGTWLQPWTDCRFYYTSRSFATNHLLPAYFASNDTTGDICEHRVYEVVERNLKPGKALRPLVTGYAGATGEPYFDLSLGTLDQGSPCWISQR
jgi:hypothetical protein